MPKETEVWYCAIDGITHKLVGSELLKGDEKLWTQDRRKLLRRFANNGLVELHELITTHPLTGLSAFPELAYFDMSFEARERRLEARKADIEFLENLLNI